MSATSAATSVKGLEFRVVGLSGLSDGVGVDALDVGDQERSNAIDGSRHASRVGEEVRILAAVVVA